MSLLAKCLSQCRGLVSVLLLCPETSNVPGKVTLLTWDSDSRQRGLKPQPICRPGSGNIYCKPSTLGGHLLLQQNLASLDG